MKRSKYSPNHMEFFVLSQCSNSGLILMSSTVVVGFSSGNVSITRCNGSVSCQTTKSTRSTQTSPDTIEYNFQGWTCRYEDIEKVSQNSQICEVINILFTLISRLAFVVNRWTLQTLLNIAPYDKVNPNVNIHDLAWQIWNDFI